MTLVGDSKPYSIREPTVGKECVVSIQGDSEEDRVEGIVNVP